MRENALGMTAEILHTLNRWPGRHLPQRNDEDAKDSLFRYNSSMDRDPEFLQVEEPRQAEERSDRWFRLSLREYIGLVTIGMLTVGLAITTTRLRKSEAVVVALRTENGYLTETQPGQIAAARAPSDQPLTYRVRVRVPSSATKYRIAYSSIWPRQSLSPQWYGAVPVPQGESLVTVRILEDPRDKRWKMTAIVSSNERTNRMSTVLPPDHVEVFRGSHEVVRTGVGRETLAAGASESIRLLDERWLVGDGALLLYGDRAPENDQVGIYVELQPDIGPL